MPLLAPGSLGGRRWWEGRPPGRASQETCQGTHQVQRPRRTGGEWLPCSQLPRQLGRALGLGAIGRLAFGRLLRWGFEL